MWVEKLNLILCTLSLCHVYHIDIHTRTRTLTNTDAQNPRQHQWLKFNSDYTTITWITLAICFLYQKHIHEVLIAKQCFEHQRTYTKMVVTAYKNMVQIRIHTHRGYNTVLQWSLHIHRIRTFHSKHKALPIDSVDILWCEWVRVRRRPFYEIEMCCYLLSGSIDKLVLKCMGFTWARRTFPRCSIFSLSIFYAKIINWY